LNAFKENIDDSLTSTDQLDRLRRCLFYSILTAI